MANYTTITIDGLSEFQAELAALPKKLANGVVRKALRAGAKPVQAEAKLQAPKLTGFTRRQIKVRAAKRSRRRRDTVIINVQIGAGDYKGDSFYASFVHWGWRAGKRQKLAKGKADTRPKIEANKFMTRSIEKTRSVAIEAITSTMRREIDATVGKLSGNDA